MRRDCRPNVGFVAWVPTSDCDGIGPSFPLRECSKKMSVFKDLDKAKLTVENAGFTVSKKGKASKPTKSGDYGKCETVAQANKNAKNGLKFMVKTLAEAKKLDFAKDVKTKKHIKCQNCGAFAKSFACLRVHFQNQRKD